ncbi:MAG: hypothetical protein NC217_01270, partial [Muribaculaceae bacterium]|nr:hypothetical protein [Muribaculaceae bacterium]
MQGWCPSGHQLIVTPYTRGVAVGVRGQTDIHVACVARRFTAQQTGAVDDHRRITRLYRLYMQGWCPSGHQLIVTPYTRGVAVGVRGQTDIHVACVARRFTAQQTGAVDDHRRITRLYRLYMQGWCPSGHRLIVTPYTRGDSRGCAG